MALPQRLETVRVRGRNWLVTKVGKPTNSVGITTQLAMNTDYTLVDLLSVDDFGKQESISVIWEVEVGAQVLSSATLPNPRLGRFDDPDVMNAFLLALRWGTIASLDSKALQSPFRSGISIEPYQLEPVLRALEMPRVNLLIADDVGLGKTIEAGLVVQELILRHRAKKVMIVCPSPLTIKWYEEMLDKFGLEFFIVNSASLKELRRTRGLNTNPFKIFPRTIVSMDWIKSTRAKRLLDDVMSSSNTPFPREFDILIVDEVHHFAPKAASESYATATIRTKLLQRISPHFEHRLFLSATPHNGHEYSFRSLLSLLDPQKFTSKVKPPDETVQAAMVRRVKSDILDENGNRRYPTREVTAIAIQYTDSDLNAQRQLDQYIKSRRANTTGYKNENAANLVLILLKKRLYSSPLSFKKTLAKHMEAIAKESSLNEIDISDDEVLGIFNNEYDLFDDGISNASDEYMESSESDSLIRASSIFGPATQSQDQILNDLSAWAEKNANRPDAKANAIIRWIQEICALDGKDVRNGWNDERVILFTEYRDTQDYLKELLAARGVRGDRIALLNGSTDEESREKIKGEFQHDPREFNLRVILATDAASEGIDLQRYCHRMLHVEIPFSPVKLEQRIGRIDRHGQRSPKVEISHFVSAGWDSEEAVFYKANKWSELDADYGFLNLMAKKIATIEGDLGPISTMLSSELCNVLLGRKASENVFRKSTSKSSSLSGVNFTDTSRAEKARDALRKSIGELGVEPENIIKAIETALKLAHQPSLAPISLKNDNGDEVRAYKVAELTRTWAKAVTGLVDPLTGQNRALVFDPKYLDSRSDVLYAHLNSPLVSQALSALRANLWQSEAVQSLSRVSARYLKEAYRSQEPEDFYVIVHGRLVIFGSDGTRLHEEVISSGGRISAGSFRRFDALRDSDTVLAAATFEAVSKNDEEQIVKQWQSVSQSAFNALVFRERERFESIQNLIFKRSNDEAKEVEEILLELERTLEKAVSEHEKENGQAFMFSEDLQIARESDLRIVRERINKIPEEIEQEKSAIAKRYEKPFSKVFPAAVEFLIPRSIQW